MEPKAFLFVAGFTIYMADVVGVFYRCHRVPLP
ncbi:hypothetical protein THICB2_340012 [Thiomonas sp. CB2]|nr:hypothetical protein THICB2_340012 [Thiomonas sp. CB2]